MAELRAVTQLSAQPVLSTEKHIRSKEILKYD